MQTHLGYKEHGDLNRGILQLMLHAEGLWHVAQHLPAAEKGAAASRSQRLTL